MGARRIGGAPFSRGVGGAHDAVCLVQFFCPPYLWAGVDSSSGRPAFPRTRGSLLGVLPLLSVFDTVAAEGCRLGKEGDEGAGGMVDSIDMPFMRTVMKTDVLAGPVLISIAATTRADFLRRRLWRFDGVFEAETSAADGNVLASRRRRQSRFLCAQRGPLRLAALPSVFFVGAARCCDRWSSAS